jgi:hypothetical protein
MSGPSVNPTLPPVEKMLIPRVRPAVTTLAIRAAPGSYAAVPTPLKAIASQVRG